MLFRSVDAVRGLARRGLYVEPTAAAAAAGLTRLQASGAVRPEETTVLVLTGSGLKASAAIGEILPALVTMPLVAIVATLVYFDLRIRNEGFDLQMIAAELARGAPR